MNASKKKHKKIKRKKEWKRKYAERQTLYGYTIYLYKRDSGEGAIVKNQITIAPYVNLRDC